jgi:hypothetical protein
MQKTTVIALLLAPILGPILWWAFMLPGRYVSRLIWKHMPDGRLKRILLRHNNVLDPEKVWPKLPPGP